MIPDWNPITQSYEFPPDVFVFNSEIAAVVMFPALCWGIFTILVYVSPTSAIRCTPFSFLAMVCQAYMGAMIAFPIWSYNMLSIAWNVVPQFNHAAVFVVFLIISAIVHFAIETPIILYLRTRWMKEDEA